MDSRDLIDDPLPLSRTTSDLPVGCGTTPACVVGPVVGSGGPLAPSGGLKRKFEAPLEGDHKALESVGRESPGEEESGSPASGAKQAAKRVLYDSPLSEALRIFRAAAIERPIPVTVLSGFLGAGKTTLVNRILKEEHGMKIAVVVNDMSVLNVDARLMAPNVDTAGGEALVELSNGCICCTLRDDLLEEVARLVANGKYDYLLIESTGISEPMPVAAAFSSDDANGQNLSEFVKVDTMVTVVDAARLTADIESLDLLRDRAWGAHESDERGIADLMVDQIEFADVIVLNKTARAPATELPLLEAMLKKLNARAKVYRTNYCNLPLDLVIGTGTFSMESARLAAGWARELLDGHQPEDEEFDIGSMLYTRKRPFHPGRLWAALQDSEGGIPPLLRIKGFCWMADSPAVVWEWSSVGASMDFRPFGEWKAATLPRESWPLGEELWDEHWGDRSQQVVFIGQHLPRDDIERAMDACLLTDEEVMLGEQKWTSFHNPMNDFGAEGALYLDMK